MEIVIPKKVLIVDDDAKNRTLLQKEFEDRGYKALLAGNGHEALAQLTENKLVDVILLDLRMPDMSGLDFLRQMRKEGKNYPVILCTAYAGSVDPFELQDLGVKHTFTKPIDLEKLATKVRELVPDTKKI